MSSERQNKPDWRQSLLQWEQSGGQTEPKEDLLWEKLQEKLQPKKKRTAILWSRGMRIAAAVLILLAVSLLFLLKKDDNSEKPQAFEVSPSEKETAAKIVKEEVSAVPVKQELIIADKKKNEVQPKVLKEEKLKEVAVDSVQPIIASTPEVIQPIIENKVTDSPAVVKVIPPKRKLRIVHINELNAPPPPTYASLKEEFRPQIEPEPENIIPAPSIWPGKNKPKPSNILGN